MGLFSRFCIWAPQRRGFVFDLQAYNQHDLNRRDATLIAAVQASRADARPQKCGVTTKETPGRVPS
jgi:hypothetical protein